MSPDTKKSILLASQIRAARALLRVPAEKLAEQSGVSLVTIRRAEALDGPVTMMPANLDAIRRALETAGVEFIEQNGGGPGVRMREPGG